MSLTRRILRGLLSFGPTYVLIMVPVGAVVGLVLGAIDGAVTFVGEMRDVRGLIRSGRG